MLKGSHRYRRRVRHRKVRNRYRGCRNISTGSDHEGSSTASARPNCQISSELLTIRERLGNLQCLIPVVMSGIIAVYSLVIAVLIAEDMRPPSKNEGASYSLFKYVYYPSRLWSKDSRRTHAGNSPTTEIGTALIVVPNNSSFMHLGCGIAVGMTGLAAGYCIGVVGDKGVRAYMEQSRVFVGMVLILIFGEVLGLYGYAPNHSRSALYSFATL